jgi:hypothetical protein
MSWSHRVTQIDGRPAQILIDQRFRGCAPIHELPRLGWFGIYAQLDPGQAFWDPEESASLDAVEADLIRLCEQFGRGLAVYVLRIATRGIREYFVYFGGSGDLGSVLPSLKAAHPDYHIEYDEKVDGSWNRYTSCSVDDDDKGLYPITN